MPTRYVIKAENIQEVNNQQGDELDAAVRVALSRATRRGAFEAADVLIDAFGENTRITIDWELCPHNSVPKGTFDD